MLPASSAKSRRDGSAALSRKVLSAGDTTTCTLSMYLSLLKTIHALVFTLARSTGRPTPPRTDDPPLLDSSPSVPRGSTSTLSNMRRNRLAYLLGGWHDISAPQPATYPHQNVSCALTCVYCVRMSMIPRYARPCGVSSARS